MKKSLLAATILTVASASAFADYQIELDAEFSKEDYDNGDITTITLGGEFYLQKVNTANVLLKEAAFLDKASHVGAHYNSAEIGNVDGDNITFDGRYVVNGERNFIVEAQLGFGDLDVIGVAGGLYLDNETEVLVGFANRKLDAPGASSVSRVYVEGKKLLRANDGNSIVAEAMIEVDDGDLGIQAAGDYYLSNQTSIGAVAGLYLEDNTVFELYGRGQHFITEQFAVHAELGFADVADGILFTLGATGRF